MDVFEQFLTSGSSKSVNPETLEYIGQRASTEFLEKRASLNQAIVKLAGQHPELNNEHISRIVEFANNATFQHLFERDKDKNVHFPIADPGVVIRDLRDGGSPAHSGQVLNNKDYHRAPLREEKDGSMGMDGSGAGDPESGMADLFQREQSSGQFGQGEPIQKVASAGLDPSWEGSANPINDVYAEHLRLKRSHEEIAAAHESADLMFKQASTDFYKAAKEEVLSTEGAGFQGVVEAMASAFDAPISTADITKVAEVLMRDGVKMEQLGQRTKVAGRLLNPEHPLIKTASAMYIAMTERAISASALQDISIAFEKTSAFLKSASRT